MHGEGAPVEIGEPGYAASVHEYLSELAFRPHDGRIEVKVDSNVAPP